MNPLLQLDYDVFALLNGSWHHPLLDWCMPWWREKTTWVPFYLALVALVAYRMRSAVWLFLLAAVLSVGLADTISSKVFKPAVHRLRPCNDPEMAGKVRLLTDCGKAFSFTSSHAANHFALAAFLSLTLAGWMRGISAVLYIWAGSIAYGQVYVGVHYPSDVLAGAILGLFIGNIVAKTYLRLGRSKPTRMNP